MATFLNENFVPDNPLLKMMKPLPADFNFGAAFAGYTDTLVGTVLNHGLYYQSIFGPSRTVEL